MAKDLGLRWQDRGPPPPPPDEERTTLWRGQKYRPGSGRWANSGGTNKQWYSEYAAAKKKGVAAVNKFISENGNRFISTEKAKGPKELREWNNYYRRKPELVESLTAEFQNIRDSGRSR